MATALDLRQQKIHIADRVMKLVQDQLVSYMPYLNRAILRMPADFCTNDDPEYDVFDGWGTDGNTISCNADHVIESYKENKAKLPRAYMHMVFHCIYCHPFQYDKMSFKVWDFACDMAVEKTLLDLNIRDLALPDDGKKRAFLQKMEAKVKPFTAENLYHYYLKHEEEAIDDIAMADIFHEDNHEFWVSFYGLIGKERFSDSENMGLQSKKSSDRWKQIGKSIQLDVEAFDKYMDTMPGSAIDNIKAVFREKHNYADFLKKFVAVREEIQVNQEEFDYIYYTYGMQLYGNLPLIEPLEYQELNKVHDFVIAIDTSGSCQGKIVRSFLNKTYTILRDSGVFMNNMNVHIIQCDCKVHSDQKITSQSDLDQYLKDLKIHGYGGTDFRPVFEYVNQMVKAGEFRDLRGLLYLTDGLGTFPKMAQDYPTAFIIIEDPHEKPKVPAWAIKLILSEDEI